MIDEKTRESVLAKMKALSERTTNRGFTEAEALAAAKKLGELSNKYNLALSDIEIAEEKCEIEEYQTDLKDKHPINFCLSSIGAFTDCKVWWTIGHYSGGKARIKMFGLPVDVQACHYLVSMVRSAMDRERDGFMMQYRGADGPDGARKAAKSFSIGMASRIGARLREMKRAQDAGNRSTGRDLVVVKAPVVEEQFNALNLDLKNGRNSKRMIDPDAYGKGVAAGDRVSFNRPLGSGSAKPAIE
jgi:hypothetical protein